MPRRPEPQQCHCHAEAGQKGTTWNNTQLDIDGAGHKKWNSELRENHWKLGCFACFYLPSKSGGS